MYSEALQTTNQTMGSTNKDKSGREAPASNTTKDNMSLGSAESLAPRWVSPDKGVANEAADFHWIGILRDDTMLVEYCNEPNNPKLLQMSRRFLKKKHQKPDWEFKTYAVQSQRRMVHALKFKIYDKIPLSAGARAKLTALKSHKFLNGESVRIIEYQNSTNKYLIRPSIPLPEAQKLATTGMLVVHADNIVADSQEVRVWEFAMLYDGKRVSQNAACQFMEKILIISEQFRGTDEWVLGSEMSQQNVFAPILASQMEAFVEVKASIDESLEYTKALIEKNQEIVNAANATLHPAV